MAGTAHYAAATRPIDATDATRPIDATNATNASDETATYETHEPADQH